MAKLLHHRKFFWSLASIAPAILALILSIGFWHTTHAATQESDTLVVQLDAPPHSYPPHLKTKHVFSFNSSPQFSNLYEFWPVTNFDVLTNFYGRHIVSLQRVGVMHAADASISTNDPGFTLNPLDIDRQWGLVKAGFPEAWKRTYGSQSVVIALIDTGVDQTHEDLKGSTFTPGFDVLANNNLPIGSNSDDNGHGTLIAGVIAATPNNNIGIAGTNWNVTLMPVKALDKAGSGNSADVSQGIVWAVDHGAKIVNLSLGGVGFEHDTTLANAITYAYRHNVLVVAAAGNDVAVTGGNLDNDPVFPICNDNGENMVLGVAATDQFDLKAAFSNFGKACIDVSAPGKRILSTINHDPLTGAPSSNAYAYASGTSLAAPFVSGQAALLWALNPEATNKQIRDRIISSTDFIDNLNLSQCGSASCRGLVGTGRINVSKSLDQQIEKISLLEGDVVRVEETGLLYVINGGKKQLISAFVQNQRFSNIVPKSVRSSEIAKFPDGPYAEPLDGTLVKDPSSNTVYYIQQGLKLPLTYTIFQLRGFQFSQVHSLSFAEVNSWLTGSFLTPPEGMLVRTSKNRTVFWVVSGALHPINNSFFLKKGLSIFPVVYIQDSDIKSLPKGEAYIL